MYLFESDNLFEVADAGLIAAENIDGLFIANRKYYTVIGVLAGRLELHCCGRRYVLAGKHSAVIPRGCCVSCTVTSEPLAGIQLLFEPDGNMSYKSLKSPILIENKASRSVDEIIKSIQLGNGEFIAASENLLFELEARISKSSFGLRILAERVYDAVSDNADAFMTVKDLAKHFGYAQSYLSKAVSCTYGIGLKKLIDITIAEKASAFIQSGKLTVNEAAVRLGFAGEHDFAGFCRYHGLTGMYTCHGGGCYLHASRE